MSIPYNSALQWGNFLLPTENYVEEREANSDVNGNEKSPTERAVNELLVQAPNESYRRGVQFIRDVARLVLKVPVRSAWTPIVLPKNWRQRERAKVNAKLTAYSFVQLISISAKFFVALTALAVSAISFKKAQYLLDKSENVTAHLDGRASQLEALKEEGRTNAKNKDEFNEYKSWLYNFDPKTCRVNSKI